MFRSLAALRRISAVVISAAVHVGAIAAGGHALSEANPPNEPSVGESMAPPQIEVELDPPAIPTMPPLQAEGPSGAKAVIPAATHRHSYPIAPDHDAHPHDPSIVHLPFAPTVDHDQAPPPALATSVEAPLRFVLAVHAVIDAPTTVGVSGTGSGGTAIAARFGAYDEDQVNVPARLVGRALIDYPADARAAQVETDVNVELWVDAGGRVVEARPLSTPAYGFERAAIRAVRAYRFSPAKRQGRPVAVHMRWTVSFRLE